MSNYRDVLKSVFCENRGYNRKNLYLHQILIAESCILNYLYTIILQPNIFVNNEIFYIFDCYSKYMNIATTYKCLYHIQSGACQGIGNVVTSSTGEKEKFACICP